MYLFCFKAAIGSVSLDTARERGFTGMYAEELGIQVNSVCINSGRYSIKFRSGRLRPEVENLALSTNSLTKCYPFRIPRTKLNFFIPQSKPKAVDHHGLLDARALDAF